MTIVNWSDIVAECGNYKAAFVATFRKYEGMPTDERDGRGVVKVTRQTFAEHMGIPINTFHRWVRQATSSPDSVELARAENKAGTLRSTKSMARKDPAALVDAIEAAGPAAADQVYRDMTARRLGRPPVRRPTPADVKGQRAHDADAADKFVAPLKRSLMQLIVHQLDEAREEIEEAIAKGNVSGETLEAIEEAAKRLLNTVQAGKVFVQ